jgi:hypothetical protein
MSRVILSLFYAFVFVAGAPPRLLGQARENDNVATVLAVQNALYQGRQHLLKNEAKQAVEVLEAKLPYINGNKDYLSTLRDAYWAWLKELQRDGKDDKIPQVLARLKLLDPTAKLEGYSPVTASQPPATPAPEQRRARAQADDDPFQQKPLADRTGGRDLVRQAEQAYREERDADAARLFQEAFAKDPDSLGPSNREHWAYCRIHLVVARLNQIPGGDRTALAALETEVRQAQALAGDQSKLNKFGQTVLDRIREQGGGALPASAPRSPDGAAWVSAESANFRVLHLQSADAANRLLAQAEQARVAIFEKWFGPANSDWNPKCEIYLHASAADYSRATKGYAQSHGHSTIEIREGRVARRRLDLVADNTGLATSALPRELTHVVLADLFPNPLLPRWADEAMAILAEPRPYVETYLKSLPKVRKESRLFAVGQLITMAEFPDSASITTFYVQSVSLTDMLVSLRGPKAFAIFLQDARRYGWEKALDRNYAIRGFSDLQTRWQRHVAE